MIGKDPFGVMVLSVGVCLTGAFALVLHTGADARQEKGIHYDFNFQGATAAVTSVFADMQRGGKILQSRTGQFFAGITGAETPVYTASAAEARTADTVDQSASSQDADDGGFKWSEGKDYGGEDQPEGNSLGEGYESRFGGNSGGSSASSQENSAAAAPFSARKKNIAKPAAGTAAVEAGDKLPPPPGRPSHERRGGSMASLQRGYASVAGNDQSQAQAARSFSGGTSAGTFGGSSGRYAGEVSGGSSLGDHGGGAMDAAMDSLRSGAQGSYNASVGRGASAVSAASASSGGSAPAASAASEVSGGGGSSSASGGSTAAAASSVSAPAWMTKLRKALASSSGTKTAKRVTSSPDAVSSASVPLAVGETDTSLLKTVVSERLKGAESRYISRDDVTALDESQLKPGAMTAYSQEKTLVEQPADPAMLKELSAARQTELKKEVHVFLKQVESRYGAMADIFSTSCSQAADVCSQQGLTGTYMTMTTVKGAQLVLGVKYVENRWRRYTISFRK